ncbi:MAG TPA: glycoside hydrolase [Bacteroidota bacterium]|nr:glycoside hydrolase [Bacteroidota bacterium]
MKLLRLAFLVLVCGLTSQLPAQSPTPNYFSHLHWRMIGPHRGGRTVGAAGIPDQPNVFYIGVNNGGVWRTSDYGRTWKPIFDNQPTGSVGALAVAPSNPDILYVGSGEGLQRPDLSTGDGVFKSTDEGKTWQHMGLADAQQIGAVIVDPRDPDRVLVAVLGHPYGANEERGVFRSTDGGRSWQKVLYKDENTGAIALEFDPTNPDIVFASLWSSRQGPWENGAWQGKTSGLFKSADRGTTWRQLTNGLPTGEEGLGRIGFAISYSDPSRMYALVDAPELGGVYRSDDAGEHWVRVTAEGRVWGRGSDFAEIKVDPQNKDVVYSGNVAAYRSTDGGKTFTGFKGAPGGDDYHGIWINPLHPEIILFAADQGAVITVNGGESWSSWYNQPTAQFYHVITDNQFPYNVYGGQQESGSVGIVSRGDDGQVTFREWHPVGADEYAYVAPDPLNPNIVYGGRVTRFDKTTGQTQNVAPEAVRSGKYRNLRTQPLHFSPADPTALYYATNVLFKTTNGGTQWSVVSPDLSRETPDVPANVGIFTTPELAKQPRRGVIYSLALSPLDADLIWAGTDDGLIHTTRDDGKNWQNVTPPAITSWSKVAGMEAGRFDVKTAYAAVNRIKLDDMRPHIYRTHDGGATWNEIVAGLPVSGPVNAVREDPARKGLLYAGTERSVYVSFDDGDHWHSLRNNMPATSIRDLIVHDADIVVGTHGRSFWILDDVSALRQMDDGDPGTAARLFAPDTAVRIRWNMNTDTPLPPDEPAGENPPDGAIIDYYLPADAKEVTLDITDGEGNVVRRYSSADVIEPVNEKELRFPAYWIRPTMTLSAGKGMNRFVWDLHHAPPENLPRSYPIAAVYQNTASNPVGPWVMPGDYTAALTVDGKNFRQPLTVKMDPRVKASPAVLRGQFDLSIMCYRGLDEIQHLILENRSIRSQITALLPSVKNPALKDSLSSLDRKLKASEGSGPPGDLDIIYTTIRDDKTVRETLNGVQTRLLYVMMLLQGADAQPTDAQKTAAREGEQVVRTIHGQWEMFKGSAIRDVNRMLKAHQHEKLTIEGVE